MLFKFRVAGENVRPFTKAVDNSLDKRIHF